jgi:hypothetical protein
VSRGAHDVTRDDRRAVAVLRVRAQVVRVGQKVRADGRQVRGQRRDKVALAVAIEQAALDPVDDRELI